jgi:urate oxidase
VRDILFELFATKYSPGVQQTEKAVLSALLEHIPQIAETSIALPNVHYWVFDISRFPVEVKPNETVFIPTSEPSGYITATMTRQPKASL